MWDLQEQGGPGPGRHRLSTLLTSTEGERTHICPRGISLGKPTLLLHVRYLGHSFSHMPRNSDLTRTQSLNFLRLLSQSATNTVAYGKRNVFSCSSGKIRNQAQQGGPGGPGEDPSSALPVSGGGRQTLSSCSGHLTPICLCGHSVSSSSLNEPPSAPILQGYKWLLLGIT